MKLKGIPFEKEPCPIGGVDDEYCSSSRNWGAESATAIQGRIPKLKYY